MRLFRAAFPISGAYYIKCALSFHSSRPQVLRNLAKAALADVQKSTFLDER
jgi:hypothetical protein